MPIKTNFLELEKLQGHENYNGDIENNNLDKIDAAVRNHEDRTSVLEDKIHKKDQLTVELKPEKKVVSISDSFGGACGFEIEGALIEQVTIKGNLESMVTSDSSGSKIGIKLDGTWYLANSYSTDEQVHNIKKYDKWFLYCKVAEASEGNLAGFVIHYEDGTSDISTTATRAKELGNIITASFSKKANFKTFEGDVGSLIKESFMSINMTANNIEHYTEEQMLAICRNGYIDGMQPLRGVAIESVGKNLVDIRNFDNGILGLDGLSSAYRWTEYNIVSTHSHKFSFDWVDNFFVGHTLIAIAMKPDGTLTQFNLIVNGIKQSLLNVDAGRNKIYFGYFNAVGRSFLENIKEFMFIEGTQTLTDYEPHKSSKIVLDDPLVKLPNGVADKIVRENGKTIKYANTNVGRDGEFYTIKDSDVTSMVTANTKLDWAKVKKPTKDYIGYGKYNSFDILLSGFTPSTYSDYKNRINTVVGNAESLNLWVGFEKGTSLEQAKTILIDSKVVYQLANPQTIELSDELEPINSDEGYTQFSVSNGVVENEKANLILNIAGDTYALNIFGHSAYNQNSPLNFKVKTIDKVDFHGKNIIDLGSIYNTSAYGNQRWIITKSTVEANNIDINQIYVDYTTSETNGQANVKLSYNADMSSAVSSNSNSINVVGEQVDKNTLQKANKVQEGWIEPSLLNGWVNWGAGYEAKYYKDDMGIVRVTGLIKNGQSTDETILFNLPEGYRPTTSSTRASVGSNNSSAGLIITSTGAVLIDYNVSSVWLSLDFSFRAGD